MGDYVGDDSPHAKIQNDGPIGGMAANTYTYAWFLARDVIYSSRACYDISVHLSVCLWRKCIVVTVHAGKRGGVISRYASHCYGPLVSFPILSMTPNFALVPRLNCRTDFYAVFALYDDNSVAFLKGIRIQKLAFSQFYPQHSPK